MKPTYDRGAIMREAGRLMREAGMARSDAMRAAWSAAKSSALLPHQPHSKQQQAGFYAALKRYGIDADRLAERARTAVLAIAAAIDTKRLALLPPPAAKAIDLKRGSDGVYRV